jgi:hypothetical protein
MEPQSMNLTDVIGAIPYRMALAGGWIDQPFVSQYDPAPPGSMVVVSLEPSIRFMDRAGMATGTRKVARLIWDDTFPERERLDLVRELYREENRGSEAPSGSQDMIGLIYPGISRIDYDHRHERGIFPCCIESVCDPAVTSWLEKSLQVIPVGSRPQDYSPLGEIHPDPDWVRRLGRSGADCFRAILDRDLAALGRSMNECMKCWETILPATVRHPALQVDLPGLLRHYQAISHGAMYSGCGGGYLYVASESELPGSFRIKVRLG